MSKPLVRAILDGSTSKVKRALKDHSGLSKKDENGRMALHYAAEEGQPSIVRLLISKKVITILNAFFQ